jgi:hypothetical protein
MNGKIVCFILIIGLALSMSGCCYMVRQTFATPTPLPSATEAPTQLPTATPQATSAPYPTYTATPSPAPAGYVASYSVILAAQTEGNNTIRITNMGGSGAKYLSYLKVTNNGMPVDPVGLTTTAGSSGVFMTNATTNRIVVNGYFIDNTQKPLMDTTVYKE